MNADLAQRLTQICSDHPAVLAVYLFGSVARGTAGSGSDIDVAVLLDEPPRQRLNSLRFSLEGDLERALGRPVDLIVLNDAPVDLRTRVIRDGQILLDRDRAARIRFEVRTRNEAFDLEPILTRYRMPRERAQ